MSITDWVTATSTLIIAILTGILAYGVKLTKDATKVIERAWMAHSKVTPIENGHAKIYIKNFGHTPARPITWGIKAFCTHIPPTLPSPQECAEQLAIDSFSAIAPDQEIWMGPIPIPEVNPAALTRDFTGACVVVVSRMVYEDAFGDKRICSDIWIRVRDELILSGIPGVNVRDYSEHT